MSVSDWADLCPQTIVWEPRTGRDGYGKPTYAGSVPQTFAGRRVLTHKRVAAEAAGQAVDVLSTAQIWILGTPAIQLDDRVYVQGDTQFPPVVSVDHFPDENGEHHVKVYLGSFTG